MDSKNQPRITLRLDARLARYALLAGAAIASTKLASAGIITNIFPSPVDLLTNTPFPSAGSPDAFQEAVFFTGATVFSTLSLRVAGYSGNGFFYNGGHGGATDVAFRFVAGDVIGSTNPDFQPGAVYEGYTPFFTGSQGLTLDDFTAPGIGFVGFDIANLHFDTSNVLRATNFYGFAELDGTNLVGFAFSNDANTPITIFDLVTPVPEPGSLALLALGAAGLAAVRKRVKQR